VVAGRPVQLYSYVQRAVLVRYLLCVNELLCAVSTVRSATAGGLATHNNSCVSKPGPYGPFQRRGSQWRAAIGSPTLPLPFSPQPTLTCARACPCARGRCCCRLFSAVGFAHPHPAALASGRQSRSRCTRTPTTSGRKKAKGAPSLAPHPSCPPRPACADPGRGHRSSWVRVCTELNGTEGVDLRGWAPH
jgi:hypothetical protein